MSGIAGIIYPDLFHIHLFMDSMLETLAHRGPAHLEEVKRDVYTYKNIRLGISGGSIASNNKKTVIALIDGHIYNTAPIRAELIKLGYQFSTHHSPELVVHAFDAWGETFVNRLDGDFAVAVFDRPTQTLYIYRDRVGMKPLYWYYDGRYFLFASELKSLLTTGLIPQTPAPDAMATYLSLGYVPQDMSLIDKVNKLLPAHYLKCTVGRGPILIPYWSYGEAFLKNTNKTENQAAEGLDQHLSNSVVDRLSPGTNPGCFLSGGVGSATIAHTIRRLHPTLQIPSYTYGFQGQNEADVSSALGFAETLGLKENFGMVTPETLLDDFVQIVWHLDEPLADPNCIATWGLAKLAATKSRFVYSGMGCDELVAGHGRYTVSEQEPTLKYTLSHIKQQMIRSVLIPLYQLFGSTNAFELLKSARSNPWQVSYIRSSCIFSEEDIKKATPTLRNLFTPDYFLHRFHHLSEIKSLVSSFLYLDFKTRLPDLYIAQYERLTVAHGLDWRAPFLAKEVIEFLASFPEPSSLHENETASLLKNMLGGIFPEELIKRPKKTRKNFLHNWVQSSHMLPLFQALRDGALVESAILSDAWIEKATANEETARKNFRKLWSLLTLEVWYRLFINFPVATTCPELTVSDLLRKT